jgi:hypothetical protein
MICESAARIFTENVYPRVEVFKTSSFGIQISADRTTPVAPFPILIPDFSTTEAIAVFSYEPARVSLWNSGYFT